MGSLAFAAAARAVWGVTKDEADEKRRLFVPVKANLSTDSGGLAYSVQETNGQPSIAWEASAIPGDADRHMGTGSIGCHDAVDEAVEFLRTLLAQGPLPVRAVDQEGREAGFSNSALRRGRLRLGLRPFKDGYQGRWLLGLSNGAHAE
jgi:putative DNA primase/helicase